jgi:DGQHR domain-containing protein
MKKNLTAQALSLQAEPLIYLAVIPGRWLLEHCTPSWRIKDPKRGFQRIVKDDRARAIAIAVLDQQRSFPNAIVLATDRDSFLFAGPLIEVPHAVRFLVVDGQHRLWAQKFSAYDASYACVIHMGLSEVQMAQLFLEINDNQKRVPASLRWDLVRLVRPEDDPHAIASAELVYRLATDRASALYQRIDLTGEQTEISLKQGSLAPEIRTLVSMKSPGLRDYPFETQYEILLRYLAAIRASDPDGWRGATSAFYRARVLRALLRLLPALTKKIKGKPESISPNEYKEYIDKIEKSSLADDAIRALQGSAGMKQIAGLLKSQMDI